MTLAVKICGFHTGETEAVQAAVAHGAAMIGFVFLPNSPNAIAPEHAADLAACIPEGVIKTGLFVDADDATLRHVLATVPLDMLQLHGDEPPARVTAVKRITGLPVMKALRLKTATDFASIAKYDAVADRLLFDSRSGGGPSGGPLDWARLRDIKTTRPWMLAGGLTSHNLGEAVRLSGATLVDVSSGVEDAPGIKSPDKIRAFLAATARL